MRSEIVEASGAESANVTNRERGAEIQRRRERAGITSLRQFEEAMEGRVGRGTLAKVEDGTASPRTYRVVEAWLDNFDEENGLTEPSTVPPVETSPIRVRFKDVTTSSIGEIIVEGPSDHSDDLIATISKLLAEIRKGENT